MPSIRLRTKLYLNYQNTLAYTMHLLQPLSILSLAIVCAARDVVPPECTFNGDCRPGYFPKYIGESGPCPNGLPPRCGGSETSPCLCSIDCTQEMRQGCKKEACQRSHEFFKQLPQNFGYALEVMSECRTPVGMIASRCTYSYISEKFWASFAKNHTPCNDMFQYSNSQCSFNEANFEKCQEKWRNEGKLQGADIGGVCKPLGMKFNVISRDNGYYLGTPVCIPK